MSDRTVLPSGLVTFMFTDIEGSTRLARLLGESYRAILHAHRGVIRAALRDFGGVELFTEGDSFFVAFSDASAAVAASVIAQRDLAAYPWPSPDIALRVRMGLHTGWAAPVADEYASAEVHRAARVAAAAHGGQVLCSESTTLAATTWSAELTARPPAARTPLHPQPAEPPPEPRSSRLIPSPDEDQSAARSPVPGRGWLPPEAAGKLQSGPAILGRRSGEVTTGSRSVPPIHGQRAGGQAAASWPVEAPATARSGEVVAMTAGPRSGPADPEQGAAGVAERGRPGAPVWPPGGASPSVPGGLAERGRSGEAGRTSAAAGASARPSGLRDANATGRFAGLLSAPRGPRVRGSVEDVLAGVDLVDLGLHRLRGFDDAERLFQLTASGLEREFPRVRTPGAPVHNLPAALTSFVGRRAEVAELTGLLGRHRLVTVAGGGGTGKTRVALAAAGELLVAYPDGVWLVDAASGAGDLVALLAAGLALRTEPGRRLVDTVLEQCAGRRMLIVLDTCEAQPAAGFVRRLLAACPGVAVLATGREPVGVHGEVVWRIPPLAPEDAFTLLSERAAAARGGRAVGVAEAADLARVTARLDGLPLAIELAATRLQVLSPAQLAGRLDDLLAALDAAPPGRDLMSRDPMRPAGGSGRSTVAAPAGAVLDPVLGRRSSTAAPSGRDPLTAARGLREGAAFLDGPDAGPAGRDSGPSGPRGDAAFRAGTDAAGPDAAARQDSLTRSLDWSYRRLGDAAAALLRRLSVFAGAVELSAVEWFGADALAALSELAGKSMVEVGAGPRYRMSAPVRAYAGRQLTAAGEEPAARDRHAAWALQLLDDAALDAEGQPRAVSPAALAPHVAEWTAALRWSATGGSVRAGLRLAGALDPWWREQGGARDGRDLLYRLYGRLDGAGVAPAALASAYLVHAGLSDDRVERDRFLDRAEILARQADDPALLIRALAGHRITLVELRRFAEAEQLCRRVIGRAEQTGAAAAALPSVLALAELLWRDGKLDEAADLLGGARQWEAGRPQDRGRRTVDWLLGMVALRRGDLVAAHDHLVVALRSRLRHGFRGAAADAVAALAVRCVLGGDPASAAVLFGGAESVRGERRSGVFGPFWSAQQAAVRATLGDETFDAAYVDGAEGGFTRVVALALAVEHPDLAHGSARFAPTSL